VVWKVDLSARAVFRGFPEIKRRLWGGELWGDGYFVRTVDEEVSGEVIRKYIEHHRAEKKGVERLKLFEELVRGKWCERAKSMTRICWKPRRKRRGNSLYIANSK
jgi:hypothetical protein